MSIRPAIALPVNATVAFLWESDELGAYVTAERELEGDGCSRTYVTLWLLASDGTELSGAVTRLCRTVSGEIRRWVTVEWLPICGDASQWVDGCDGDDSASTTLDELVMEAKERAATYARSLRARPLV